MEVQGCLCVRSLGCGRLQVLPIPSHMQLGAGTWCMEMLQHREVFLAKRTGLQL